MMSSPLDPGLPYLSEREIAFHESTLKCEVENMGTFRMKSYSKGHRAESCQRVMASGANVVYVNDFDCAESMLAAIEESSLTLGEDIFVITMDWLQKNNVPKGMVSIQQNYGLMLEKAIEWAQTDLHSRIQALIVPDLVHNMGIGSFQGG
jgi:DNA-binding LacI/PurR family transcriptional regulator